METKYWTTVKEFGGLQLLRDPETFQCRIVPIERQAEPKTKSVETPVTPEQMARAEAALNLHKMLCEAGERSRAAAIKPQPPQPERPKTPEEAWRRDPALRAEFNNNINAYLAYCKAVESGRCRIYGQGTSRLMAATGTE